MILRTLSRMWRGMAAVFSKVVVGVVSTWILIHLADVMGLLHTIRTFAEQWLAVVAQALFWPSLVVLSIVVLLTLRSLWIRWSLVRFADSCWLLSIDPALRVANYYSRRRGYDHARLIRVINGFRLPNGSPCYRYEPSPSDALQAGETPLVVLKLPARNHLSLIDFQDLRLMRGVIAVGARVLVIVVDVPYRESDIRLDMSEPADRTRAFARRVLGSKAQIVRLSEVFSRNIDEFLRFLLDKYIPYYARTASQKIPTLDAEGTVRVSYMTFALLLSALASLVKSNHNQPVVVVQWRERLARWTEFETFIRDFLPGLRVAGFVVGESFPDYNGKKLLTSVDDPRGPLFAMTTSNVLIAQRLLALGPEQGDVPWIVPDEYVSVLAQNILGMTTGPASTKEMRGLDSFLKLVPGPLPAHVEASASVHTRYRFYREFCRVQGQLRRGVSGPAA